MKNLTRYKIGIDMDDTICSTKEKIEEYQKEFICEKDITVNALWTTKNYKIEFLNKYLEKIYIEAEIKEGVIETLQELKRQGNKLYIITARSENYVSDINLLIRHYLEKYDIEVDDVFINAKDKVDICKSNNIDIMIDDSIYNYNQLTQNNIKTILFDEYDQHEDITMRVSKWSEMLTLIIKLLH